MDLKMKQQNFEVEAFRASDGKRWLLDVPSVKGATQVTSLADADSYAAEYIHLMTDIPIDKISTHVHINLDRDLAEQVDRAKSLKQEAQRLQTEAAIQLRTATKRMRQAGLKQRDIAAVLGVTPGRVSQLSKPV
jgi:predicted XRE-type DNA-binding protein